MTRKILAGLIVIGAVGVFALQSPRKIVDSGEPHPVGNNNCEYANGLVELCPPSLLYTNGMNIVNQPLEVPITPPAQPADTPADPDTDTTADTPTQVTPEVKPVMPLVVSDTHEVGGHGLYASEAP